MKYTQAYIVDIMLNNTKSAYNNVRNHNMIEYYIWGQCLSYHYRLE